MVSLAHGWGLGGGKGEDGIDEEIEVVDKSEIVEIVIVIVKGGRLVGGRVSPVDSVESTNEDGVSTDVDSESSVRGRELSSSSSPVGSMDDVWSKDKCKDVGVGKSVDSMVEGKGDGGGDKDGSERGNGMSSARSSDISEGDLIDGTTEGTMTTLGA